MADVVTFDPVNLRIVEIDTGGDNELDTHEIYSEWKQWLLDDYTRRGYPPAFSVVGGEPTSANESLGIAYFLQGGWKIRPSERSHKLTIVGDLFVTPATESAFVNTLGAFTVNTETRLSNRVIATSASDLATQVWSTQRSSLDVSGTAGQALLRLFNLLGLDPTKPLVVAPTRRYVGDPGTPDIDQTVTEGPAGTFTVTTQ